MILPAWALHARWVHTLSHASFRPFRWGVLNSVHRSVPAFIYAVLGQPRFLGRTRCIDCALWHVQGNEFSYYMLLTSDFILNACERAEQWTVYPYIHSNCNHLTDADQLRQVKKTCCQDWHPHILLSALLQSSYRSSAHLQLEGMRNISYHDGSLEQKLSVHNPALVPCAHNLPLMQAHIPDILPGASIGNNGRMRMSAGDFVEVYSAPGQAQRFDCVVTCFFLDTAHNIIQYLEIIASVLKVQPCDAATLHAVYRGHPWVVPIHPHSAYILRLVMCCQHQSRIILAVPSPNDLLCFITLYV